MAQNMNKSSKLNDTAQTLDINVLNLILTPLTCASLISEILKCLIFEKSLIPYPYNWLKNVAISSDQRKQRTSQINNENIFAEKQYRLALTAYNAMENIITNIKKLFKFGNNISEIIVLIGATPLNPKEVYKFTVPKLATGHNESNHFNFLAKLQPKILRSLFLSQEWMSKMEKSIPLTNLFVFVKIADGKSFMLDNKTLENFLPSCSYFVPRSAQCLTINLLYDENVLHNCCNNLTVYEDNIINNDENNSSLLNSTNKSDSVFADLEMIEVNRDCIQANSFLKGFKESFNVVKTKIS